MKSGSFYSDYLVNEEFRIHLLNDTRAIRLLEDIQIFKFHHSHSIWNDSLVSWDSVLLTQCTNGSLNKSRACFPWTPVVAVTPLPCSCVYLTWFYRPVFTGPSVKPQHWSWPELFLRDTLAMNEMGLKETVYISCVSHDHQNQGSMKERKKVFFSNTVSLWFLKISHLGKPVLPAPDCHSFPVLLYGTFLSTSNCGEVLFSPMVWSCTIYSCSHKISISVWLLIICSKK